VQVEDKLYVV